MSDKIICSALSAIGALTLLALFVYLINKIWDYFSNINRKLKEFDREIKHYLDWRTDDYKTRLRNKLDSMDMEIGNLKEKVFDRKDHRD